MVDMDDRKPLWVWENEGGTSDMPKRDRKTPFRPRPRPEDTPDGCLAMAAADMVRAAGEPKGWARIRFEHSAVMWSRRAKWLQQGSGLLDIQVQTGAGRRFC